MTRAQPGYPTDRQGKRGLHVLYRGAETVCPGCGRSHWHVGRSSAECAFCGTAIALQDAHP